MKKNFLLKITKAIMWLLSIFMIGKELLILQTMFTIESFDIRQFTYSISLLLIYIIPIFTLSIVTLKVEKVPIGAFLLAFVSGGFMIGSFSGLLNYSLTNLLIPKDSSLTLWIPSIVPPFTEELLKISVVLLIVYIFKCKTLKSWLVIGVGAGLGFQFLEDYTYILSEFIDGNMNAFNQALQRIQYSFSTHWLMTGIFAAAIFLLIYKRNSVKTYILIYLISFSWIYHIIWNSPYVDYNKLIQPCLGIIGLLTLWYVVRLDNKLSKCSEKN